MAKLEALGNRVLVEVAAPETMTAGGIIIPESKVEKQTNKGKVVSVGTDVKTIKLNDFVFFNKFTGTELDFEKFKYLSLKIEDIYAVVK
jgi:chaperonin GroES